VPRILLEDTFDFKPDRTAIIESRNPTTGITSKRIPGTLSVCDCINGNRRRYPLKVWEKNLSEGSILRSLMARKASFGLLEHPADGKVDLRSPISHITTEATLAEGKDADGKKVVYVKGCIEVIEGTPEGKKLAALIEAGYDPLVSSRGYGSLNSGADGIDEVQEDFVCEGWDVVSTPSFTQATLKPERASAKVESVVPPVVEVKTESLSAPAQPSVKAPVNQINVMDITKIKESIGTLKGVNPTSLDARSFASGIQRMAELHNAAAKHLSENASASWEVDQLHRELSTVEESWVAAYDAPRKEVKQLKENEGKLLSVVKKIVTGISETRKVLSECRSKLGKSNEIAEAVAKRGRAWMETARRERDTGKVFESKYEFCTEALDIMATRYKGDVAELGARVIELEFPTMTEEQKKALGEAKTPKAVLAVRESIEVGVAKPVVESKTEPKKPAAPAPAAEVKKAEPITAPVVEAKKEEAPAPHKDNTPARPMTEGIEIVRSEVTHSVLESIGMGRRLSQGQAALRG
jgi:Straboviridae prohead core protein protease